MHLIEVTGTSITTVQTEKETIKNSVMKNVSQLQAPGETPSKPINYFTNIDINVSMKVKQRQGCEMHVDHG